MDENINSTPASNQPADADKPKDDGQPSSWARLKLPVIVGIVAAIAAAAAAALLINIFERKQEGLNPFYKVVNLSDNIEDPAEWGKNFPLQYDAYKRTVDQQRTRFGGSESVPRTPEEADPRSTVAQSRLTPELVKMWAGYAFSVDFREERGHAYMLEDQTFTQRQKFKPQPGTCLNCHASMVVPYRKAGNGDIMAGFNAINSMPYAEARALATHPVSCIDCHDPSTMQLRITRPAFMEGIKNYKAMQGVENYDVNTMASRQEMRSYVCAQCHVEYYFKGDAKTLVYPWHKGIKADQILAYYDEIGFKDWDHAISGAPAIKAQHPEFEMWSQGIHSRSNVACADCHMPYKREGAMKISDHQVQSPMLNINRSCQTCHKWSEEELKNRVETIQDSFVQTRQMAMHALVELIDDIAAAKTAGFTDEQLASARDLHRKAQFLIDFVEAENSNGFHAPQESMRILARAMDFCRRGQKSLAAIGARPVVVSASE